eukprot:TRINITY_DN12411_c0_g1_i1.p2 TRINITY_DN12411_c0_g1~~TRINITY_DN12411_c0_g1_i1.p2  ORF type:complete len:111 (-),score=34.42 TRINITY_DN12411_c0_g1_i1:432-764(-)
MEDLEQDSKGSSGRRKELRHKCRVEDRTQIWQQQVEKKLRDIRERKQEKELDGCTFRPSLTINQPKPGDKDLHKTTKRSYEKYIKRMQDARTFQEKEMQESKAKPGSGKV